MRTGSIAILVTLSCTVLLSGAGTSQSQATEPSAAAVQTNARNFDRPRNLGLATNQRMLVDGTTAVFVVVEEEQHRDLNGDGDRDDQVVHVFDARTGATRNLRLNVAFSAMSLRGRALAICSGADFDDEGAGDASKIGLFVYDTARRTLTKVDAGCGSNSVISPDGLRLAYTVSEVARQQDLNHDGDVDDDVLHLYDVVKGRSQNTGIAVRFPSEDVVLFDGRRLFVSTEEGEGTNFKRKVVHRFDTETGEETNLQVAISEFEPRGFTNGFKVADDQAMLVVPEFEQRVDLNGDGDLSDNVLQRLDLASGRIQSTGLAIASPRSPNGFGPSFPIVFAAQEGLAVFNLAEAEQRKDLNGDGDLNDVLLHVLSTRTGKLRTLNVNGRFILSDSLPGRGVVFMSEVANGRDLNGDGNLGIDANNDGTVDERESEFVLGLADLRGEQPRVVNTGLTVSLRAAMNIPDIGGLTVDTDAFQIRDNLVVFVVPEEQQGRDLNGNGIQKDHVLHIADLATLTVRNTGLSGAVAFRAAQAPLLPPIDGQIVVPVGRGGDLNGVDLVDAVLQVVDVRSGRARNTGIAIAADLPDPQSFALVQIPQMIRGEKFMSVLLEERDVDLNGDGDTQDEVLHIVDVATGKLTNVGLAARGMEATDATVTGVDFTYAGMCPGFSFFGRFDGDACVGPSLGDAYVFFVSEAAQGNVDLNGDGDTNDFVVHATRLSDRDRNGRLDFAE